MPVRSRLLPGTAEQNRLQLRSYTRPQHFQKYPPRRHSKCRNKLAEDLRPATLHMGAANNLVSPTIPRATATPATAPLTCARMVWAPSRHSIPPTQASANVTAGSRCAPEISPKGEINATSTAPVASVLASRAMATLPPASFSPINPEPTPVASRNSEPANSATNRRNGLYLMTGQSPQSSLAGPSAAA
jgi:hypothetical protein